MSKKNEKQITEIAAAPIPSAVYSGSRCILPRDALPGIGLTVLNRGCEKTVRTDLHDNFITVSHRLGHEKVTTTLSIYTHFVPNKDYVAANLLDKLWTSEEENEKE